MKVIDRVVAFSNLAIWLCMAIVAQVGSSKNSCEDFDMNTGANIMLIAMMGIYVSVRLIQTEAK